MTAHERRTDRGNFDGVAAWYDEQVRTGGLIHDLVLPPLLALAGDVRGLRILDLATGQGVVARHLASAGARVVGVDIAGQLLAIAAREERATPRGIEYLRMDGQRLGSFADAAFDGVTCNMALINIPDLAAACRSVARMLCAGGWFAFSITHPCFQTSASSWSDETPPRRIVGRYFDEGHWLSANRAGVRGRIGDEHRTLSTYINALAQAGLLIDAAEEPRATGEIARRSPGYTEVPAALVARCRVMRKR